jgi:hypothetical protein
MIGSNGTRQSNPGSAMTGANVVNVANAVREQHQNYTSSNVGDCDK